MTLTSDRLDELRQRLAALRTRFGEVGARAAAAAAELGDSVAPAEAFVEALRGTATEFDALRRAIVHELSTFPNTPDPAKLSTLKALDAVLTAMERVRAEHARRAAWEAARDETVSVLDRVLALTHREDSDSAALAPKLTVYRAAVARPSSDRFLCRPRRARADPHRLARGRALVGASLRRGGLYRRLSRGDIARGDRAKPAGNPSGERCRRLFRVRAALLPEPVG